MMQNDSNRKQPPPPRRGLSVLVKAMLFTAVPIAVLSVVDAYSAIAGVGGLVWVAAVVACVAFAIARRGQIALGILAGLAIGAVSLGLTCFAPS
jgi:hypothetical protein